MYMYITFHLVQLKTSFLAIAHSFKGQFSNHLRILHQILSHHFLTLHHGYPQYLILSRSDCSLLIIFPYHRTRIPLFLSINPYYRDSFNTLCLTIYKSIYPLLILIIQSLSHNLFHQILVLMVDLGFLFRTSIIYFSFFSLYHHVKRHSTTLFK